MKKFVVNSCDFLSKHMWLWWLLNFTWGIIGTTIGFFMAIFCEIAHYRSYDFGPCIYYVFGDNWGGLEGVLFFFVSDNMGEEWTEHTKVHEFGHSFQNVIFGPFMLLISAASAIRYWYRRIRTKRGLSNKDYDCIWFEGSATEGGMIAAKNLGIID